MKVIIMRGLPGAGKSTWIRDNLEGRVICSADAFHIKDNKYEFKRENVGKAHDACLKQFTEFLVRDKAMDITLVVDNTNTTTLEIAPYYRLAQAFGLDVKIVHIRCDPETAFARNIHNVPMETIWRMWSNLVAERLPPLWVEVFP